MPIPLIDRALDRLMDVSSSLFKGKTEFIAHLEQYDKPDKHGTDDGSGAKKFFAFIRSIDIFPKFDPEYLRPTSSGGLGSVICFVLMGLLMGSELWRYLVGSTRQEFVIDQDIKEYMPLDFSISVATPCGRSIFYDCQLSNILVVTVVLADQSNQMTMLDEDSGHIKMEDILLPVDLKKDKIRVLKREDSGAEYVEPPKGFHNGCRITTPKPYKMTRTRGRLFIVPITQLMGGFGQMLLSHDNTINFSHIIHRLSFGKDYPGQKNPLNGQSQLAMEFHEDFIYFLTILPTKYKSMFRSDWIESNQYSLQGFLGQKEISKVERPGLYFDIKVESLCVRIKQERTAFRTFMVNLVGILGGLYIAFGLVNSLAVTSYDWLTGKHSAARRRSSSAPSTKGSIDAVPLDGSISVTSIGTASHDHLMKKDPTMGV